MNCLFVSSTFENQIPDGGNVVTQRNYELLKAIFIDVDVFLLDSISSKKINNIREKMQYKLRVLYNAIFFRNISGLNKNIESDFIKKIILKHYDVIFINQSVYGKLAKNIKEKTPSSMVVCFFHNIEYLYFKQLMQETSLSKIPLTWSAKYNEQIAVHYADKIIALNQRDAYEIEKIYHRKVDALLPTSLNDTFDKSKINISIKENSIRQLLFVGSDFFANYHGIKWFVKNVFPWLKNVQLEIVGKGTEVWREELSEISNVHVIGGVESLDKYYYKADAVVLPIFLGSGMKTKTAEALMYGKYIFGTQEAFEGYLIDSDQVGGICNDVNEFINKINIHFQHCNTSYNVFSRNLYVKNHKNETIKKILTKVIMCNSD